MARREEVGEQSIGRWEPSPQCWQVGVGDRSEGLPPLEKQFEAGVLELTQALGEVEIRVGRKGASGGWGFEDLKMIRDRGKDSDREVVKHLRHFGTDHSAVAGLRTRV